MSRCLAVWLQRYSRKSDTAVGYVVRTLQARLAVRTAYPTIAYRIQISTAIVLSAYLFAVSAVLADVPVESEEEVRQRIGSGNPVVGKVKSETELCQGCHGETGLSTTMGAPNLAGQYAAYIIKQLHDFRTQERHHPIMNSMAEGLAEVDIPDIAAYFASQPHMTGEASLGNETARNLFLYGDVEREIPACVECHELGGKGRLLGSMAYPRIGGQSRRYLQVQLLSWKLGSRTNSPKGVMNKIVGALSEEEITALAEYMSGL